jgi:peptide/nickel transport system ATP-binding protein/oligopeptide transport system ATP-binding protein
MKPLLQVKDLRKTFRSPGSTDRRLVAVDDISFHLNRGETLGLVGESGCGKSTTGKTILNLQRADAGQVLYDETDLLQLPPRHLRPYRRKLQMIFQDPFSSLNPRMTVGDILTEPLLIHKLASRNTLRDRVMQLLEQVGLGGDHYHRYPHEFSGGQRQRVGIARALAVEPELIVADEPVSALDLSIQAQILNLLRDLQKQYNLSYLFIAHDLAVIEHISDRVAVMYLGRIVELAAADDLYRQPRHPYTEALLNAVPVPDPNLERLGTALQGEIPSPLNPPGGCHFHPRCPYARDICRHQRPELLDQGNGHQAACHFSDEVGRYLLDHSGKRP